MTCSRGAEVRGGSGANWLDALMPALGDTFAASPAAQRLARSAGGRGVVVTTGQQPGLFGGPIYTWSKAIGALTLADAIERATGIPVAPVFWAARRSDSPRCASWAWPSGWSGSRSCSDSISRA